MRPVLLLCGLAMCAGLAISVRQRPITFAKDVAPFLYRKCVSCHRPGGFAPFSLLTYEDVAKRSALVRDAVLTQLMPPTDAESDVSPLCEQERVTNSEMVMIQRWVQNKMPKGSPTDLPSPPPAPLLWRLGVPDKIIRLANPKPVPAEGNSYWVAYPVAAPDIGKLGGFQAVPDSRLAVKHVLLAIDSKNLYRAPTITNGTIRVSSADLIAEWAPGYNVWKLPKGFYKAIPKSARLVVQILYQPTGKKESGGIQMGFYRAKNPTRAIQVQRLGSDSFVIPKPPGQDILDTVLKSSITLKEDTLVFAAFPEARRFAVTLKLTAKQPRDASEKLLLLIRSWDVFAQGSYVFSKPVFLQKGTVLRTEFEYDNSVHDRRIIGKRRPVKEIRFGYTNADEMFRLHLQTAPAGAVR